MEAGLSSPSGEPYRHLSLWWDQLPVPFTVRPPLSGDIDVDVAVVGGGLTGLWTAYELRRADPSLEVVVLDMLDESTDLAELPALLADTSITVVEARAYSLASGEVSEEIETAKQAKTQTKKAAFPRIFPRFWKWQIST